MGELALGTEAAWREGGVWHVRLRTPLPTGTAYRRLAWAQVLLGKWAANDRI